MSEAPAPIYPDRDPVRRCRKLADWPAADKKAWDTAFCGGDIFDERGSYHHWSDYSQRKTIKGYGRWMTWLDINGLLDNAPEPAERVTPERVAKYVADLESLNASMTVLSRLQELHDALRAMSPKIDWGWVRKFERRIRAEPGPARDKRSRMRHSGELLELGMSLMADADWPAGLSPLQKAVEFRDGLMIALLAVRPVRIKNFAAITIGRHLVRTGSEWVLSFPASETKTGAPIEMPIPEALNLSVERYLEVHRVVLCRRATANLSALWVSKDSTVMQEYSIYCRIVKRTERAFGIPINPHLFRDCAATSIAIDDPVHVRIIAPILGHASLSTSEKHYNQARGLEACRLFNANVVSLRKSSRPGPKGTR